MSLLFPVTTRFAPTPSGAMHVGHALAAFTARRLADAHGGRCLLRIEDIDSRARDVRWVNQLMEDLDWLGIRFDGEVMVQSQRFDAYAAVLRELHDKELLYPCFCSRSMRRHENEDIARAPHTTASECTHRPDRCRALPSDDVAQRLADGEPHSWRIDMQRVQDLIGCPTWEDLYAGVRRCIPSDCEDVILSRKDTPTSYHLAVVVDDAQQGVNLVTRGRDLMASTPIHRALQAVLGLPTPVYAHHPLLRDSNGVRLAKRDHATSIASLREAGYSPAQILSEIRSAVSNGGIWNENQPR